MGKEQWRLCGEEGGGRVLEDTTGIREHLGGQARNLVQWKLPEIYKSDASKGA